MKIESSSNDDGDVSENVTIKMNSCFFKRRPQKLKFPGVEFMEIAPKFRKRKKNPSSCVMSSIKTSHQEISRPSRAVTAKKCTK